MTKYSKNCEDSPALDSYGGFQEKMWVNQLTQKEIIINGEIREDIIEKAVIHIINFNKIDDEQEASVKDYVRTPITIFINSPGGYLDEAFSLISAIETSQTPVLTFGLGKCFSAAFLILLAGHVRACQKYTNLMYHQGSGGFAGEFGKHYEYVEHYKNCQDKVEQYVIEKTKIKKKKLEEIFRNKTDWFIDPEEAKELGIIDEII